MKPTPLWLRRYSKFVAASTLFLIFAGAMVTSTGSGLAVPDWPLSYGMLFPPMVGGIFYEHGHRMVAAAVGLFTVILAVWLHRSEPKLFVKRMGWVAVLAVILQGLLGGLTVRFLLPPAISIAHAALAEIFLCLTVSIAFFTSSLFRQLREDDEAGSGVGGLATLLLGATFVQILLGALMRHLGAGLAIPDFPLSFGTLVPNFTSVAIAVNFSHRVGAVVVTFMIVFVATRILLNRHLRSLRAFALLLLVLCTAQVVLGALTVLSGKNPLITSLHVVTGASLLAVSMLTCLSSRVMDDEEQSVRGFEQEVIA